MRKRNVRETPARRVLKHAVKLQVHTRTVLKTILVLCGATGLAAVAAFLTIRQATTYLSVSIMKPPESSVQQPGAKDVPMLGLRLHAYRHPITVQNITFSVLTDSDGQFENGIANNVDPAQAIETCMLQDGTGTRISGPIHPSSESRTLSFAMSVSLAAQQSVNVRAVCTLGVKTFGGAGSDQIALVLDGPQDIRVISGKVALPISAVSFGFANKLNARGNTVSIWRGRPASSPLLYRDATTSVPTITTSPSTISAPTITAPTPKPAIPTKSHPVFSRVSGSPSGSARAGLGEVLRFAVKAEGNGPVDLFRLAFHVTGTDAGKTSWLSCKDLASSAKWGLRNANDLSTRLEDPGDWLFYQADGTPCSSNDKATLAYAIVDFTRAGDPQPKAISAGQSATFVLRMDSSDASVGDTLQAGLPTEAEGGALAKPLTFYGWTDSWIIKPLNGAGLKGLPLLGGTLTF